MDNSSHPPRISSSSVPESTGNRSLRSPDGGSRGVLVALGGFLNFLTAFGFMNSFGVLQEFYSTALLHESTSIINWIGSVQVFLMFLGGIVVGPAYDKWGARRIMIPGAATVVISYACTSFATKYVHVLLSQGFLFGIRNAMLYYPTTSAIAEWFDKNRALALGFAISGSSVGGIIWTPVLTRLLNSGGFAWTHRILAFSSLPILVVACLLVKEREGSSGVDPHGNEVQTPPKTFFKEVTDKHFLLLCSSLLFIFTGMLIPFYYIPLFARDCGFEPSTAANFLAVCYAGSAAGRVSTGWIADHFGRFNVLIAMGFITSILIFSWARMTSFGGQVTFALLFGFSSGGLVPLGAACVAQTTTDIGRIGFRIGAMMAFCAGGTLSGGPVSGVLRDGNGHWGSAFSFAGGLVMLGTLLLAWTRHVWEPQWKVIT